MLAFAGVSVASRASACRFRPILTISVRARSTLLEGARRALCGSREPVGSARRLPRPSITWSFSFSRRYARGPAAEYAAVCTDLSITESDKRKAEQLAAELALPVMAKGDLGLDIPARVAAKAARASRKQAEEGGDEGGEQTRFVLWFANDKLKVRRLGANPLGPYHADFLSGTAAHRAKSTDRRSPMLRACSVPGLQPGATRVLDATAGLGRDAYVLASFGFPVTLVERNPIMHAILRDALARAAAQAGPGLGMRLVEGPVDAGGYLEAVAAGPEAGRPHVVFVDPMYPQKKAVPSSLPKLDMNIARGIVGSDRDWEQLLEPALAAALRRVVVKKPKDAPPTLAAGRAPDLSFRMTHTRFDVFLAGPRDAPPAAEGSRAA